MLIASVGILSAACALSDVDGDRVALGGKLVPPLCASRTIFGINCPGCGLTRSFVRLAHADWNGAWQMHRLGWLLALVTVAQIPYRIIALRYPGRELLGEFFPKFFGYLLIGLLIGNWLLEHLPYGTT